MRTPPPNTDDKIPAIVWAVALIVLIGYAILSTLAPLP